jgi:phage terminase large subunit GpA-like protein
MLTVGVDVQDDRLEASVVAFGRDEEMWIVDHAILRGDPGSDALWHDLDGYLARPRQTEDGRSLIVESVAVDSGGHFTQQVYAYCAKRKSRRVWAIKGAGGFGRLIWPKSAGRAGKTSAQVFIVGVDTAKDVLFGRLKRITQPGAGYIHFPVSVDEVYFDQLTAETLIYRMVQGRRVRSYKPRSSGSRTEALDCLVYAYAAFIGRNGPMILPNRKADHVPKGTVTTEAARPAPSRNVNVRRPGGWVNGWR